MRLALLGGSFDPLHIGHLYLADTVLSTLNYDRVLLIPTFQSPFKQENQRGSAADRLDMILASLPWDPRITVDDCEIRREGVSYTIDTINDIIGRYRPTGKLGLIIGDDLIQGFEQWRRAEEIIAKTDIIIAHRLSDAPPVFAYPHKLLNNALIELSSSAIRAAIQHQQAWRYLVPEGARLLIQERMLYGYASPLAQSEKLEGAIEGDARARANRVGSAGGSMTERALVQVERAVQGMVGTSRFLHSRSTALLCYDLCIRYGEEPAKGYIAGIAHDMAKTLPGSEQWSLALQDQGSLSPLEEETPSLLHARAAATLLRDRFAIRDEGILEAVREHTLGRPGMGPLAKILYVADKTEITRSNIPAHLRDLDRYRDLDSLVYVVVEESLAYLRSKGIVPAEETLQLYGSVLHAPGGTPGTPPGNHPEGTSGTPPGESPQD